MCLGVYGGLVGGLLGMAGGCLGTWAAVRNAGSPAERSLTIKASLWFWLVSLGVFALFLILPGEWRWAVLVVYWVFFPLFIVGVSRRLKVIRSRHREVQQQE
jgi:hypothetical protein